MDDNYSMGISNSYEKNEYNCLLKKNNEKGESWLLSNTIQILQNYFILAHFDVYTFEFI